MARGVGLLDPHGDASRRYAGTVPLRLLAVVLLFDLTLSGYVPAFNPFVGVRKEQHSLYADQLVYCFRNLFRSWGDKMHTLLLNAFLALLSLPNACLGDITRLLHPTDAGLRNDAVRRLENAEARHFWLHEFRQYGKTTTQAVTSRISRFLLHDAIGRMFQQRENRINFRQILDEGIIFIAHLPTGLLGADAVDLIGSILVTQFYHAALSRADLPVEQRRPYRLYLDEAYRFSSGVLADMLREGRKYGLSVVLAAQEFDTLERSLASSLGNVANVVAFDLTMDDAQRFCRRFPLLTPQDLQGKGIGEAWALLGGEVQRLRTFRPLAIKENNYEAVLQESIKRYYVPVAKTEVPMPSQEPPYDEI